ncbi:MAG TPA: class I SAM-dependent methyltransferase [Planctomycetaceae bacterium]|nr:class I SAM-dependent methyltransferase [Planctomycetaceae bacterium]
MNTTTAGAFDLQQTIDAWDSDYYHPIAERYYDRAVSRMLELLSAKPGDTVLDAGCGPGVHAIRAARAGLMVKAIDISDTMLAEARRRVERAGVAESVEFAREDLTRLSFPDSAFRHVFSWGVIIHIRDIERALDELIRIVAPGGRLALYVTNASAWDHKLETVARFLIRRPLKGMERLPMGRGIWYDWQGERLWVWRIDAQALTQYFEARGMRRIARVVGEFSEIQMRLRGPLRSLLLHGNALAYRLGLPPGPASTNLFVFEKAR